MSTAPTEQVWQIELHVRGKPIRISGRWAGQGNVVILMHGWMHTSEIWRDVVPRLLDRHHRTLTIDLPGFGDSPSPPRKLRSIVGYGAILEQLIEEIERNETVDAVVADSLSARIIYAIWGRQSRIKCANFLFSGCPFDGLPFLLRVLGAFQVPRIGIFLVQLAPKWLGQILIRSMAWYTVLEREENMDAVYEGVYKCDPNVAQCLLRAMGSRAKFRRGENSWHRNLLLVRGNCDRVTARNSQERWAKRLQSELISIENASHSPMLENPAAYAAAIESLWAR